MDASGDNTPAQCADIRARVRGQRTPVSVEFIKRFACCFAGISIVLCFNDFLQCARETNPHAIGDDFINFWSASYLAWHHRAGEIYDFAAFHSFEQSIAGKSLQDYRYSYPPTLLVLMAPFALLPYLPSLVLWLVAGWYAFYRTLRLTMAKGDALLLAAATPAVFINTIGGQNGTWTATLLGLGLSLLERRPILAGGCLGLFVNKPHLGLMIPLALLATRRWRTLAAAGLTAAALVALAALCFGPDIFADYTRQLATLRHILLEGAIVDPWGGMLSLFVAARRFGANVPTAYAVQAASFIVAALVVTAAWFRHASFGARNALVVLGTCMATPYLQDYDMLIGTLAVAWLWHDADVRIQISEPILLFASIALLVFPFFPKFFSEHTQIAHLPFGPLSFIPLFVIAAKCALGAPQPVTKLAAAE